MRKTVTTAFIALFILAGLSLTVSPAALAAEKMDTQKIIENADIKIGLSGLVCDFCALALNKTFAKNKAVAASYVDLETKVMSVIFHTGQTVDDETLDEMVKDAGYNITQITRIPHHPH